MIHYPRLLALIITTALITITGFSQESVFSKKDFGAPVDIPMYLSGTFGELRSNHFHAGIDIKTQGVEGKNIIAIDDGWVSRIKVSTSGYGKAIYITHPDGYISVYGHLSRFNDTIQSVIINNQYEKESYIVQMFFDKGELPVKKGELIAYSGNTGGSHGPHLHFEIRDVATQHPLNPLLFSSIKVKDYFRPKITRLVIYPVDLNSSINGLNDTLFLDISGWGADHKISNLDEIKISGKVSFGISTYDLMNEIPNKNGVFSTKLIHDTNTVFELEMKRLSFNTTRYINSLVDYGYYKTSKTRVVRTQVDTNNMLNNYSTVINNGIIEINDTLNHHFIFEVKDAYSNLAQLSFDVMGSLNNPPELIPSNKDSKNTSYFNYSKKNSIVTDSLTALFPANCFYQSFDFTYEILEKDTMAYSSTYKLHDKYTPVHKNYSIKVIPDLVDTIIQNSIYLAYSADNKDYNYLSNKTKGDALVAKTRSLGYFKVLMDSIPPIIKKVNFSDGKNIAKQSNLKIKIWDEKTGIAKYRATLNGSWILMEYDPKKKLLTYNYDELLLKGKNEFKLVITDLLDNKTEFECEVIY